MARSKANTEIKRELATGKIMALAIDITRINPPEACSAIVGLDELLRGVANLAQLYGWGEIKQEKRSH